MNDLDFNRYLDIPHKPQGRDRSGVDCYGLVIVVYKDLGIDLPLYENWYQRTDDMEALLKVANTERLRWQEVEHPEKFDVVLLNVPTKHGRFPAHVGVVEDETIMIHCEHGRQVCRESFNDMRWKNRIEGFFRYV